MQHFVFVRHGHNTLRFVTPTWVSMPTSLIKFRKSQYNCRFWVQTLLLGITLGHFKHYLNGEQVRVPFQWVQFSQINQETSAWMLQSYEKNWLPKKKNITLEPKRTHSKHPDQPNIHDWISPKSCVPRMPPLRPSGCYRVQLVDFLTLSSHKRQASQVW